MNTERLLEGATFLENLQLAPDKRFSIELFINHENSNCGTAACAIGHFALAGVCGLSIKLYSSGMRCPIYLEEGRLEQAECWEAAERAFDLTGEQSSWLFTAEAYSLRCGEEVTKEMVAARMRHLATTGNMDLED